MIEGRKAEKKLSKEDLLCRVRALDVYEFYLGERIPLNRTFKSPFRRDANPSFMISDRDGKIHHFDYADDNNRGNCIDFVMQLRKLGFKDALELINYDMNVQALPQIYEPVYEEPVKKPKKYVHIAVETKHWTSEALAYWESYHQTIEDLRREKIYLVKNLYIDRSRWPLPSDENVYAYLIEGKYWKIYRPGAKDKKDKWKYNGPNDIIENLYKLPSNKLILTKSRKDRMILEKVYPFVANVQSESMAAFSKSNIAYLKDNFEDVYLNFDSDPPGKRNSLKVTGELGFRHLNPPDQLLERGLKDFAGWAREDGLEVVREYLIEKHIINGN